jgi:hypothetical protein
MHSYIAQQIDGTTHRENAAFTSMAAKQVHLLWVQLEVRVNKSSAESAEQHSPGRKPWDQAWFGNKP